MITNSARAVCGTALTVKAIGLILGAGGLDTMWEAVFTDVGVALLAILMQ
ncbi:MAG TPA: hypothetical protein PKE30_16415 [Niabella sp.]|nr:hypothetical protein [Niabella sp.]